jgi:hypothetical protein
VPVPSDIGLRRFEGIDDLATHHWVPIDMPGFVDLCSLRTRLSIFPGTNTFPLLNNYTIFYQNQRTCHVENLLLRDMRHRMVWWGNILVVKHNGSKDAIVDMDETDVGLVNLLILRLAHNPSRIRPC